MAKASGADRQRYLQEYIKSQRTSAAGSSMKKWYILTALVIVFVALFILWLRSKVHVVDPTPAIEVASQYFAKLREGNTAEACSMYTEEFRRQQGTRWEQFLAALQTQNGNLSQAELLGASFVPVGDGYFMLRYKTVRGKLEAEERFLIVQTTSKAKQGITGHQITRLDNGQQVTAGNMVTEQGVRLP